MIAVSVIVSPTSSNCVAIFCTFVICCVTESLALMRYSYRRVDSNSLFDADFCSCIRANFFHISHAVSHVNIGLFCSGSSVELNKYIAFAFCTDHVSRAAPASGIGFEPFTISHNRWAVNNVRISNFQLW